MEVDTKRLQKWPSELLPVFVVSIRPERYLDLKMQMGKLGSCLHLWKGTDGSTIVKTQWIKNGKLSAASTMKRGEIGCFDSHFRLWQHVCETNLESAVILEDDVDLSDNADLFQRLVDGLAEAKKLEPELELFYFIHSSKPSEKPQLSPNVQYPREVTTMGYYLTRSGAEKLLKKAKPFYRPVDCFMEEMCDTNSIVGLSLFPAICYVRPLSSDTQSIE
jgi:glycosyl transferase, family 25